MQKLPIDFTVKMRALLKDEYDAFEEGYTRPGFRGIRLNPLKCDAEKLQALLPFPVHPAPFSPLSYYIPGDVSGVGLLPAHHAGAFYVQEPSASSAVTVLAPEPGERILDLCAAPGGKSTQIASLLAGSGLLWSNEIVKSRARILLSNIERMGVRNAVVSSCHPETLCNALTGFFDRVLVDAPCSGEGMFRREPDSIAEWSPGHVEACASRQLSILNSACNALRTGGALVYSTCTFSVEENELTVDAFLCEHPDFVLEDAGVSFGRPAFDIGTHAELTLARRIFPMDGGEGHFVARMRKIEGENTTPPPYEPERCPAQKEAEGLYREIMRGELPGTVQQFGGQVLLLPVGLPQMKGLGVIRAGVPLGELLKNRMEPSHAFFTSAAPGQLRRVLDLSSDAPETARFLRGEEIPAPPECRGYTGVAVEGMVVGFGKCSGGMLKNHYPKGLRNH